MSNQEHNKKTPTSLLTQTVLSRIEREGVKPTGRWVFLCTNYFIWILWAVTVLLGAIAVAESIYISMHSGFELYELTHRGLTDFILDSVPYVWLVAFGLMIFLAYRHLRKTQHGYRYALWQVIVSSLVFTMLGGVLLHVAGFGKIVDRLMGQTMPTYVSVDERQMKMWENPTAGRITGMYVAGEVDLHTVRFKDMLDREWLVTVHELPSEDLQLLRSGEQVRLLGEANELKKLFYVCGVLPWMPPKGHSVQSLQETRGSFERIKARYVMETREEEPSLKCLKIMHALMPARP